MQQNDVGTGIGHLKLLTEKVELFQGLLVRELALILKRAITRNLEANAPLISGTESTRAMYVILSGEVSIYSNDEKKGEAIACLGPGSCVGEMTLLDDAPRSAHARASVPTCVLELRDGWLNQCPAELSKKIYKNLSSILSNRLRATTRLVESVRMWPEDARKLSDNLVKHGIPGLDLTKIDATGAKLTDACLRESDLRGADLSGADLRGAVLTGADLRGVDLSEARTEPEGEHKDYWGRVKENVEQRVEHAVKNRSATDKHGY